MNEFKNMANTMCGYSFKKPHNLLQFFKYDHLPEHLKDISRPFRELAETIDMGPENPETTTALRKLLESKDCAVRAVLFKTTS